MTSLHFVLLLYLVGGGGDQFSLVDLRSLVVTIQLQDIVHEHLKM
jgi:hypothetical protein